MTRQISYYESKASIQDKQVVVVDFGTRYTKVGFSGESSPRCIIRSEVSCAQTRTVQQVFRTIDKDEQYDLLVKLVHKIYFKHLLVNPSDRRVVIVESLLCPTSIKETIAKVFFVHFGVPSVLFVPSHVVALSTLGVQTALVLDMGFTESIAIPVFEGVAVLYAWEAQPLGVSAVEGRIRELLLDKNSQKVVSDLSSEDIEEINVRTCFVTKLERAQKEEEGKPLPLPPSVDYPVGRNNSIVHVSGFIREHAHQILFERDREQISISTMILDAIAKCPLDMRKPLAENILIMGGAAMVPGIKARIKQELSYLITTDYYADKLKVQTFKFHSPPAKDNYTAWLGGAIYGDTDIIFTRSLSKDVYMKENRVPDWVNLIYNTLSDGVKRSL